MRHLLSLICIVVVSLNAGVAVAESGRSFYCEQRGLGTWFYCKPPEPPVEVVEPSPTEPGGNDAALVAEALAFKKRLEDARLLAAYDPSPERVRTYQQLQFVAMEKGALFADNWRRNTWGDPVLDYTVRRPTASYAKDGWLDARTEDRSRELANMGQKYGMFYFYRSDCPYCQIFSPVLRSFSQTFGVEIKAVSVDGGKSDEFPDAVSDSGQFARLLQGRKAVVPAVLLVNVQSGEPTWVSFGAVSREELAQRVYVTVAKPAGEDF